MKRRIIYLAMYPILAFSSGILGIFALMGANMLEQRFGRPVVALMLVCFTINLFAACHGIASWLMGGDDVARLEEGE